MNVGVDEAGRGCFLGPVYAAAVIWDNEYNCDLLKDSKKMTELQREYMYDYIKYHAIDYGIAYSTVEEIDSLNILQASQLAIHRALDKLNIDFDAIDVDGNYFNRWKDKPYKLIIQGDALCPNISAASILAKVERDKYIKNLVNEYPELNNYQLLTNKGYGTRGHRDALYTHGLSKFHRKSFNLSKYGKAF